MGKMYDKLQADLKEQENLCRERQQWDTAIVLDQASIALKCMKEELEEQARTADEIHFNVRELYDETMRKAVKDANERDTTHSDRT